ncbi:MAG: L,D-transpeptidase family protein [PVC group bacterium]
MRGKFVLIALVSLLIVVLLFWFFVFRPRPTGKEFRAAFERARSGDCRAAVPLLEKIVAAPPDEATGREAALLLARCRMRLRDYPAAAALWEELGSSDDPALREEAEYNRVLIAMEKGGRSRERLQSYLERYPGSPRSPEARLLLARARKEAEDVAAAAALYREVLESAGPAETIARARAELGELNLSLFLSPAIGEGDRSYTVRSGDSLEAIARAHGTTAALLQEMNKISGDIIHPGQVLKVPDRRFEVAVSKSRNTLTLLYGGAFFKEYSVGTGRNNCSPVGEFTIVTRLIDPPWIHGGETIPPFDPRNILGTRWMGFDDPYAAYGIHGTTMPETVGSQSSDGCVRMVNADVDELFIFLPRGTRVTIAD